MYYTNFGDFRRLAGDALSGWFALGVRRFAALQETTRHTYGPHAHTRARV